jgi:hypothetical protein
MDAKNWGSQEQRRRLLVEADEITAVLVASLITVRESLNRH